MSYLSFMEHSVTAAYRKHTMLFCKQMVKVKYANSAAYLQATLYFSVVIYSVSLL